MAKDPNVNVDTGGGNRSRLRHSRNEPEVGGEVTKRERKKKARQKKKGFSPFSSSSSFRISSINRDQKMTGLSGDGDYYLVERIVDSKTTRVLIPSFVS